MPTHKLYPTRGFYPKHKMLYHPKLKTQYVPIWIKWRLTATETVRIPFQNNARQDEQINITVVGPESDLFTVAIDSPLQIDQGQLLNHVILKVTLKDPSMNSQKAHVKDSVDLEAIKSSTPEQLKTQCTQIAKLNLVLIFQSEKVLGQTPIEFVTPVICTITVGNEDIVLLSEDNGMSQWNSLRANLANLFGDSFVNNRLLESILPGITARESQSKFFCPRAKS